MALELAVVRAAAERLTPEGAERIKQHLAHEEEDIKRTRELGRARGDLPTHDFHLLLADLTGNPAMRLFVQVVAQVTGALSPAPSHSRRRRPRCTAPTSASPRRSSMEMPTPPSDGCAVTSRPWCATS